MKGPNYFKPDLNKFVSYERKLLLDTFRNCFGLVIYLADKYIF